MRRPLDDAGGDRLRLLPLMLNLLLLPLLLLLLPMLPLLPLQPLLLLVSPPPFTLGCRLRLYAARPDHQSYEST